MPGLLIKILLEDGSPEGVRTMELSGLTVLATLFPRPALARILKRDETGSPGVYMLVGADAAGSPSRRVYVGEGDPVRERLRSHGGAKDFWTEAVVFTSKDRNISKTHIKFIESELLESIGHIGRVVLDNEKASAKPSVSPGERAEAEGFLSAIRLLVGVAGFDFLRQQEPLSLPNAGKAHERNVFEYKCKGAHARMIRGETGYVVLQGSTACVKARESISRASSSWIRNLREELVRSGILVDGPAGLYRFSKSAEFPSPTAAGVVVAGGEVNGRIVWRHVASGKTLREVELAEVGEG